MLSPFSQPACSPIKRSTPSAGSSACPGSSAFAASPSKPLRSPLASAPLYARSPQQGPQPLTPSHITAASPSARRGLFGGADDGSDASNNKAGATFGAAATPPAQLQQGLAGRASASLVRQASPPASSLAQGQAASTSSWDGDADAPPHTHAPFNLAAVAASAHYVAAAVLSAGNEVLQGGSGSASCELARAAQLDSRLSSVLQKQEQALPLRARSGSSGRGRGSSGKAPGLEEPEHVNSTQGSASGAGSGGDAGQPSDGAALEATRVKSLQIAQLLVSHLSCGDDVRVQGALTVLLDRLQAGKLAPAELLDAGGVPALADLIEQHSTPTQRANSSTSHSSGACSPAANLVRSNERSAPTPRSSPSDSTANTTSRMRAAAAPSPPASRPSSPSGTRPLTHPTPPTTTPTPNHTTAATSPTDRSTHSSTPPASPTRTPPTPSPVPTLALEAAHTLLASPQLQPPSPLATRASAQLLPLVQPVLDVLRASAASLAELQRSAAQRAVRAHADRRASAGAAAAAAAAAETEEDDGAAQTRWLPASFYAGSIVVRLSNYTEPAAALVRGGGVSTLAANLTALPTILPQVSIFALYKLLQVGSNADNLLELMEADGPRSLVAFMGCSNEEGGDPAACELAASILLSFSLLPEAPQAVVESHLISPLVQLLGPASPSPAVRMYALLVLGRLASRSSAVQMDLTREGAVPFLVDLMGAKASEAEQLHAARLMAIVAQSVPTHQALQGDDVMRALLRLLQCDRPSVVEHAASVFSVLANNPATHFQLVGWGVVPRLVGLLQPSSSRPPSPSPSPFAHGAERESQSSHAGSSLTSLTSESIGSGSCSSCSMGSSSLCATTPKGQTYVLATLLLLAMHEPRHADVICRSNAIPNLVELVSSGDSPNVREYSAAVLACMAHTMDVQMDIIGSGGIPALVQLLDEGAPEAQAHAAEVLVTLAAVDDNRKRLMASASGILGSLLRMLQCPVPTSRYWGATLLHLLCHDDAVLLEVIDMEGVPEALVGILEDAGSPMLESDARLAQVQAAWLVCRACESPRAGAALAQAGAAAPLVALVAAGLTSSRQGLGGSVHYGECLPALQLPYVPNPAGPRAVAENAQRMCDEKMDELGGWDLSGFPTIPSNLMGLPGIKMPGPPGSGSGSSGSRSYYNTGSNNSISSSGGSSSIPDATAFQAGGAFGFTSSSPPSSPRPSSHPTNSKPTSHMGTPNNVAHNASDSDSEHVHTDGKPLSPHGGSEKRSQKNSGKGRPGSSGRHSSSGKGSRHVVLSGGGTGAWSSMGGDASGGAKPRRKRTLRVEALDANGHAAGVAALLALARSSAAGDRSVGIALAFQEAWAGGAGAPRVVLPALDAPAIS